MREIKSLRVFVAMPGTTMGAKSKYKNPEAVKKNLLVPIIDRLKSRLNIQDVQLVIEKDKLNSAPIHKSMFREAEVADVYIADLTGSNPNVYLELGVRWALRDGVTVVIAQSVKDLKFNVGSNRAFVYTPENIVEATENITTAIVNGLKEEDCDSIVRSNSDVITIPRSQMKALSDEVERLKRTRGEDLMNAARATENLDDRILKLTEAVKANPASAEAFLELGKAYRDSKKYDEAINNLRNAHKLKPLDPVINRELGVTYSKQKKLDDAIYYLREAVRLAPEDAEAWSNLGGALRRIGMIDAPASFHQKYLEEARDSYSQAHRIHRFDLYAGLNVARLNLLLSKWDPSLLAQAQEQFKKQIHLCRNEVQENPGDYWRMFDLADALLFAGQDEEAFPLYDQAISLVPKQERQDKLSSVMGPFKDYLSANVLTENQIPKVQQVISLLTAAATG